MRPIFSQVALAATGKTAVIVLSVKQSRCDPRPPQRGQRALHLFVAETAHHLVDDRSARGRQFLDVFDLVLADTAGAANAARGLASVTSADGKGRS
ncbi:MAG: hypothetical protein WCC81_03980 [Pseudolabrys sp.]